MLDNSCREMPSCSLILPVFGMNYKNGNSLIFTDRGRILEQCLRSCSVRLARLLAAGEFPCDIIRYTILNHSLVCHKRLESSKTASEKDTGQGDSPIFTDYVSMVSGILGQSPSNCWIGPLVPHENSRGVPNAVGTAFHVITEHTLGRSDRAPMP
jgi:hypothetical protein